MAKHRRHQEWTDGQKVAVAVAACLFTIAAVLLLAALFT